MLNKVVLQGRFAGDPELRHTQNGVAVATFRLAVTRDFKEKDGERKADFISVVCWRGTAEFVSRFFQKGSLAVVEGRLQVRDYTDRDGNKRFITEVIADNVYFSESRKRDDTEETYQAGGDTEQTYPASGERFADISDNEDLPF